MISGSAEVHHLEIWPALESIIFELKHRQTIYIPLSDNIGVLRILCKHNGCARLPAAYQISYYRKRPLDRIASHLTPLPKLPGPAGHRECQCCSPPVEVHTASSFRPIEDVNARSKEPRSSQLLRVAIASGDPRVTKACTDRPKWQEGR